MKAILVWCLSFYGVLVNLCLEFVRSQEMPSGYIYMIKTVDSGSIITTKLSAQRNSQCYTQTLRPLLKLLQEEDFDLEEDDIDGMQIYGWQSLPDIKNISRYYFESILKVKKLLPAELVKHRIMKKYAQNRIDMLGRIFDTQTHDFGVKETANLVIACKNFKKGRRSIVDVLVEVSSYHVHSTLPVANPKIISEEAESGIFSSLFRRNRLGGRPLNFRKFGATSIYSGLVICVVASSLCGISFVLKKRSLLKMDKEVPYYKNKGWWMAHSLMVLGDLLHFVAFFFTPAVLVCTLQMLMILVTAYASSSLLGENINTYWKLAFASSLGGCLVILVHVPIEPHIHNISTFLYIVSEPLFVVYAVIILITTIVMMAYFIPKWGRINSLAYTVQSAIFGSIVVVTLKGVLLIFSDRLFHWVPLTCIAVVGICLLLQLEYLNKALTYYNTLVVTTQYYVTYSSLVIIASSLMFEVWKSSSDETILVLFLGFATSSMGVLIFAIFQEDDATFDFSKLFVGPEVTQIGSE